MPSWTGSTPDDTPRANGAKSEYYCTLNPPYQPRDGLPETIEELLLVREVTPQLLFGLDTNRNGLLDRRRAWQRHPARRRQLRRLDGLRLGRLPHAV